MFCNWRRPFWVRNVLLSEAVYHMSYAQKNHQIPIYRHGNESLLFHTWGTLAHVTVHTIPVSASCVGLLFTVWSSKPIWAVTWWSRYSPATTLTITHVSARPTIDAYTPIVTDTETYREGSSQLQWIMNAPMVSQIIVFIHQQTIPSPFTLSLNV